MENSRHSLRLRLSWLAIVVAGLVVAAAAGRAWLVDWRLSQAQQALVRRDPAIAISQLMIAQRLAPGDGEVQFWLARAFRRTGRVDEVKARLLRAEACGFSPERVRREWILTQAQAGVLTEAEPHLRRLLTDPGDDGGEICAAFVNGYAHHYRFPDAFKMIDAWQADYPNDAEPHVMAGKLHQRFMRYPEAEQAFRRGLQANADDYEARFYLAQVLSVQHKYDEALEQFDICRTKRPDDPALQAAWAECLAHLGRTEEARTALLGVVRQMPGDCDARVSLARLFLDEGDASAALRLVEPALSACPHRADVKYVRAQALKQLGRVDEAQVEFARYEQYRDAQVRVAELTMALASRPQDVETRYEIATILMEHGSPEEGAAVMLTVLAIAPGHAVANAVLAEYYSDRGEHERARQFRGALQSVRR